MNAIALSGIKEKYRVKFIEEGKENWEEFTALDGVSLACPKGSVVGIIGKNGAGKTTILRVIAGMLVPDSGKVEVNGKVSVLMDLGAGFNPELTGRKNIELNAQLYGIPPERVASCIGQIIEFADIGRFIDAPVKYYSQGMYVRLAFALAIFVEPEILLIDDILSVGDEEARQKCVKKIFEIKARGTTIVVVSHDMHMIQRLCDRVIFLEHGKVLQEGTPKKVIPRYIETLGNAQGIGIIEKAKARVIFNNGRILVSYDGLSLTTDAGGFVSFRSAEGSLWQTSSSLFWTIEERSSEHLVARGQDDAGTTVVHWKLLLEDRSFRWEVILPNGATSVPRLDLFLRCDYGSWMSVDRREEFPSFKDKMEWQDLGEYLFREGVVGLVPDASSGLAPLSITSHAAHAPVRLFNSGYYQEARILHLYGNDQDLGVTLRFFPGENDLVDDLERIKTRVTQQQSQHYTFVSGAYRLFFESQSRSLKIYYGEHELTKGSGLHCSFLSEGQWYNLSSADCDARRENEVLVISLQWYCLRMRQVWRLWFEGARLKWEVSSHVPDTRFLEMLKFGIVLSEGYRRFFCGHQEQDFPDTFTEWRTMDLEDEAAQKLGVRAGGELPTMVMENTGGYCAVVQNSNRESSSRILQLNVPATVYGKGGDFSFACALEICPDESLVVRSLQQSLVRRYKINTISCGRLKLCADATHKAIRLYFEDRELTKGAGIHSAFLYETQKNDSNAASWQVHKDSETELSLAVSYAEGAVRELWRFSCEGERLAVSTEVELSCPGRIADYRVKFDLQDIYTGWRTPVEEGAFSSGRYIDQVCPVSLRENKVPAVALTAEASRGIPLFHVGIHPSDFPQSVGLCKFKWLGQEYISLNCVSLIPKRHEAFPAGRRRYFQGTVSLGSEPAAAACAECAEKIILSCENLQLIFESGKSRIVWKGSELTSGLGLYTSLRSAGIWYDSSQAIWTILKKEGSALRVAGDWLYVPVSQVWEFEVLPGGRISWSVEWEVVGDLAAEIVQANCMLSRGYRSWAAGDGARGVFNDDFTREYDILPFRIWYGSASSVSAAGPDGADVRFSACPGGEGLRAIVENSNDVYRARLLQFQTEYNQLIMPGRYPYFKGALTIGTEG